jgi:malate permease and related proteins
LSPIVLSSFGFILYENTLGFYITARGNYSGRESFAKVLRLPAVYAFVLGLVLSAASVQLQGSWLELFTNIRGAYSVLGMMMIGLGIADLNRFYIDLPFTLFACFYKFLVWPVIVGLLLWCDLHWTSVLSQDLRHVVFFMSTLPLAANIVPIASLLETEPERAAVAVLLSTLLAVIVVPVLNGWFVGLGF